jgi:Cytochrome c
MRVPLIIRIAALVLATTGFYAYVGQMVPQKEVQPPAEIAIRSDLTTADMVKVGREIMDGKGLCFTCHTIGKTGALRFPDLEGVDGRAKSRVPGLSDVEYFAQSMYEPNAFIVPGFNPGMPTINQPPIGLTDQEILCVIAYLQTLGGTATVTLQTTHHYHGATAAPGGAPAPAAPPAPGTAPAATPPPAPPKKGAQLRPAILKPVAAHQAASRPAVAAQAEGVPASDGDRGSGAAKSPGLVGAAR